ncbi:MAG: hypothetical protein V1862_04840 [Methanobacteriota archaeon]
MADFIQNAAVKSALRKLTSPIEDMATFQALITDIIMNNPWGCVDYVSGGVTIDGCLKGTERYTGKVIYENGLAKTVGQISIVANIAAGFATDKSTIIGTAPLGTAMGGTPSTGSSEDGFSVQIKCNHTNGEKYTVTVKRNSISLSSYVTDAIKDAIETWADAYAGSILA